MKPADEMLYEYSIVRFVPKPDRGECVNIGLVMMNKRRKWLKGKIHLDEEKILSLFPDVDLENLYNQAKLFEKTDVPLKDLPVEERYRWLTAVKSGALRVSPSHPGLAEVSLKSEQNARGEGITTNDSISIMEEEFSRLFSLLIL